MANTPIRLGVTLPPVAARHHVQLSKDRRERSPEWRNRAPKEALTSAPMPLEGHWRRTNTPLRRLRKRERNVAIGATTVTLLALLALVLVPASETQPPPAPGCIRVRCRAHRR